MASITRNHQQNLNTMRGAKSNALLSNSGNWNHTCPCVALVICATFGTHYALYLTRTQRPERID